MCVCVYIDHMYIEHTYIYIYTYMRGWIESSLIRKRIIDNSDKAVSSIFYQL